jgi:hypothetical protein
MATQLGELSIDAIETDKDQAVFVRGVFTSLHNKNVYVATRAGGARLLFDARESAGLPVISEADLEDEVRDRDQSRQPRHHRRSQAHGVGFLSTGLNAER